MPAVEIFLVVAAVVQSAVFWGGTTDFTSPNMISNAMKAADAAELPSSKPPKILKAALEMAGASEASGALGEGFCRRMVLGTRNTLNTTVGMIGKTTARTNLDLIGELEGAALDSLRDIYNSFEGGLGGAANEASRALIVAALFEGALYDTQLKRRYVTLLSDKTLTAHLNRELDGYFRWLPGGHVSLSETGLAIVAARRKKKGPSAPVSGTATPAYGTGTPAPPSGATASPLKPALPQPEAEATPRTPALAAPPGPVHPTVMPPFEVMMPPAPPMPFAAQAVQGFMELQQPSAPVHPPVAPAHPVPTTVLLPVVEQQPQTGPLDQATLTARLLGLAATEAAVAEVLGSPFTISNVEATTAAVGGGPGVRGGQRGSARSNKVRKWFTGIWTWMVELDFVAFVDRLIGSMLTVTGSFTVTLCFAYFGHLGPTVGGAVATVFAFYRWFSQSANQILVAVTGAAMLTAGAGVSTGAEALGVLGFATCFAAIIYAVISGALVEEATSRAPSRTPSQAGDHPGVGAEAEQAQAALIADLESQLKLEQLRSARIEAALARPRYQTVASGAVQVLPHPVPVHPQPGEAVYGHLPPGTAQYDPLTGGHGEVPATLAALTSFAGNDGGSGAYTVTGQHHGLGQGGVPGPVVPMASGPPPGMMPHNAMHPGQHGVPSGGIPPPAQHPGSPLQNPWNPMTPAGLPHFGNVINRPAAQGGGSQVTGGQQQQQQQNQQQGADTPDFRGSGVSGGLPPNYSWMGWQIYWWVIRVACGTCVQFLERFWPGARNDGVYLQLYQKCTAVDSTLEAAFSHGGSDGVEWMLRNDVATEISLNSLACEWDIQLHGDAAAAASLLAVRPAGMNDLLPQWALGQGRLQSRDVHRQHERTVSGKAAAAQGQSELFGLRRRQGWLGDAIPGAGPPGPKAQGPKAPGPKAPRQPKAPKLPPPSRG
jgi:hypothetical protein